MKQINFGMGEHSAELQRLLLADVDEACSIVCGLQQPDHSESNEHAQQCIRDREEWDQKLRILVHSINERLLGENYLAKLILLNKTSCNSSQSPD